MKQPIHDSTDPIEPEFADVLKERYRCPRFRILVIGRANAGKTTILEKVSNVKEGTKPIVYDKDGMEIKNHDMQKVSRWGSLRKRSVGSSQRTSWAHSLVPSVFRGEHEVEHQITYPSCNFIFHESRGFESGGRNEIKDVRTFMKKRSVMTEIKDQLHAIWYCIPMDSCRPYLPAEQEFFDQSTGKVPLVVVFTKFDALMIQECCKLEGIIEDEEAKWNRARENAERTFQDDYLKPIMSAKYPPKAFVVLEHMAQENADFSQLIEKTAHAVSIGSLRRLFTATQTNSLNLCIREALEYDVYNKEDKSLMIPPSDLMDLMTTKRLRWEAVASVIMPKFPHFWVWRLSFIV